MSAWDAERNARLLLDLIREHGAREPGSIPGFFETGDRWHCPVCFRSKSEIARLDKNGNLLCAIHLHHDHFGDFAANKLPRGRGSNVLEFEAGRVVRDSFYRFQPILICNDCNVAEGAAKKAARTVECFSFTPFEISGFIIVTPNAPHRIDSDAALRFYAAAKTVMSLYGDMLRKAIECSKDDSFEQIGGAAWRVLKAVREKMKDSEP